MLKTYTVQVRFCDGETQAHVFVPTTQWENITQALKIYLHYTKLMVTNAAHFNGEDVAHVIHVGLHKSDDENKDLTLVIESGPVHDCENAHKEVSDV